MSFASMWEQGDVFENDILGRPLDNKSKGLRGAFRNPLFLWVAMQDLNLSPSGYIAGLVRQPTAPRMTHTTGISGSQVGHETGSGQ